MILPLLASDMLSIPLPNIDWAIQIDTTQGGLLLRDVKISERFCFMEEKEHERRNFHL